MRQCKKNLFTAALFFLVLTLVFGESMPESPKMPEISGIDSPKLPEISDITLDSSFYKPEIPGMKKKKLSETDDDDTTLSETSLSAADSTDDLVNSILYDNNVLSAKDISALSDVGLFDSLSSITGSGYSYLSQTSNTEFLLKRVLTSLDDLKKEQSAASQSEKVKQEEIKEDLQTFKTRNPSVLRFMINGYDIKPSLTTVFFSQAEEDGSFLFTGDRKYYANKKNNNETFYMLFKAEKELKTGVTYSVTPTVVQDVKNENSFLYQLAQKGKITAEKTGNLVVVHYSQNNWNMDLLLDIDSKIN